MNKSNITTIPIIRLYPEYITKITQHKTGLFKNKTEEIDERISLDLSKIGHYPNYILQEMQTSFNHYKKCLYGLTHADSVSSVEYTLQEFKKN